MAKNVLLCYARTPTFTNAVKDYVEAFGLHSENRVHYFDMDSGIMNFDLDPYDCIIFSYCVWSSRRTIGKDIRNKVRRFNGLKIAIFQDEYIYFLWHESAVLSMRFSTVITCVPEKHWKDVFRGDEFRGINYIHALTGYISDSLLQIADVKPIKDRRWVIGYRGRPVPSIYGQLTREKVVIGERMKQLSIDRGLSVNIELDEDKRLYGDKWLQFLGNCRAVLGTESGSNIFDFDGKISASINSFVSCNPQASFESVYKECLQQHDGIIEMNQISPRVFEAIAMKTALVLFEGKYSGVIKPWEHFIPLKKDFSNVEEVFTAIDDDDFVAAMVKRAYNDVLGTDKFHYESFIRKIDQHICERVPKEDACEPCFGLIGWRTQKPSIMSEVSGQSMTVPTSKPYRHTDYVPDPVLTIRINWGAIHRKVMRLYLTVLYSKAGRAVHDRLRRNIISYRILRRSVHVLTGRWRGE